MKRAIRKILFLLVMLSPFFAWAQPRSEKEEDVKKYADELFEEQKFVEATQYYLRLLSIHPRDYDYNYKYGTCLLYNSSDKKEAFKYLKFAIQSPSVPVRAYFYLGKAYHLNYEFNQAIKYYTSFMQKGDKRDIEDLQVEQQMTMCRNGKKLLNDFNDLIVMSKRPVAKEDFFRLYDLQNIDGTLLVTEDFATKEDEKRNHVPLVFFPSNPSKIFYASHGEDGEQLDIYMKKKLPTGGWAKEQIVMGGVNTGYDENYPFFHEASGYLYFSSKGHNSMGGYDVFRSRYNPDQNSFEPPENVDFAISSPDDDLFYIVDKGNKYAYFASSRESESGQIHVYQVRVERFPAQLAVIKGNFKNSVTPGSKACSIKVLDARNDAEIGTFTTNKSNGDYLITFPKSGKYKFFVEAESSEIIHTSVIEVPYLKELRPLKQEMELVQKEGQEQLVIRNKFDERFENPQAIMAEVMKQKSQLKPNADEYDLDSLDRLKEVNQILEEIGLPTSLTNEDIVKSIDDQLEHASTLVEEQTKTGLFLEQIALEKDSIAKAKKKQAEALLSEADNTSDPVRKDQLYNQAKKLLAEAVNANEKSVVAAKAHQRVKITVDSLQQAKNELSQLKEKTVGKEEDRKALLTVLSENKETSSKLSAPLNNKIDPLQEMVAESRANAEKVGKEKDYLTELTQSKRQLENKMYSLREKQANAKKDKEIDALVEEIEKVSDELAMVEEEIFNTENKIAESDDIVSKHINEILNQSMEATLSMSVSENDQLTDDLLSQIDQNFKSEIDRLKIDINDTQEQGNVAQNKVWSLEDFRVDPSSMEKISTINAELRKQKYLASIAENEEDKQKIEDNIQQLQKRKEELRSEGQEEDKMATAEEIQSEYREQKQNIKNDNTLSKAEQEKQLSALENTMKEALAEQKDGANEAEQQKIDEMMDEVAAGEASTQEVETVSFKGDIDYKQLEGFFDGGLSITVLDQNMEPVGTAKTDENGEVTFNDIENNGEMLYIKINDAESYKKGELSFSLTDGNGNPKADLTETDKQVFLLNPKVIKDDNLLAYEKKTVRNDNTSTENNTAGTSALTEEDLSENSTDEVLEKLNVSEGTPQEQVAAVEQAKANLEASRTDDNVAVVAKNIEKLDAVAQEIAEENNIATTTNNTADETYESELSTVDISSASNEEVLEKIEADGKTPEEQLVAINKTKAALKSSKTEDNADVVEKNIEKLDEVAADLQNEMASNTTNNTTGTNALAEEDISKNSTDEVLEKLNVSEGTPQEQVAALEKAKANLEASRTDDNAAVVEKNIEKLDAVAQEIAEENNIATTTNNTSDETYESELSTVDISSASNEEVLEKIEADGKTPEEQLVAINKTKAALKSSKTEDNAAVVAKNIEKLNAVAQEIAEENNIATTTNNNSDETYESNLAEVDISANTNEEVLEKIEADGKTPEEQLVAINKVKVALESSKTEDNADVVEKNIEKLDEVVTDLQTEMASNTTDNTTGTNALAEEDISENSTDEVLEKLNVSEGTPQEQVAALEKAKANLEASRTDDNAAVVAKNIEKLDAVAQEIAEENNIATTTNNTSDETYESELSTVDISSASNEEVLEKIEAAGKTPEEQLVAINKTKAALKSSKTEDNADVVEKNIEKLDEVAADLQNEMASNTTDNNTTSISALTEEDLSENSTDEVLEKLNVSEGTPQEQVAALEKAKANLEASRTDDNAAVVEKNIEKLDAVAQEIAEENNIATTTNNTSDETYESNLAEVDISANTNEEVLEKIEADGKTPEEQLVAINKAKVALKSSKTEDNADVIAKNIEKLDAVAQEIAEENNIATTTNNTSDETYESELSTVDISSASNEEVLEKIEAAGKTPEEQLVAINKTKAALKSSKTEDNADVVEKNIEKLDKVAADLQNEMASNTTDNNTAGTNAFTEEDLSGSSIEEVLEKLAVENSTNEEKLTAVKNQIQQLEKLSNTENKTTVDNNIQKLIEVKDGILAEVRKEERYGSISFGTLTREEVEQVIGADKGNDKSKIKKIEEAVEQLEASKTDENTAVTEANIAVLKTMKSDIQNQNVAAHTEEKDWASIDFGTLEQEEVLSAVGIEESDSDAEKTQQLEKVKRELIALQEKNDNPQIQENIDVIDQMLSEMSIVSNTSQYENEDRKEAIDQIDTKDFSQEDKATMKSAIAQEELKATEKKLQKESLTEEEREALEVKKMQLENEIAEQNQIIAATDPEKAAQIETDQNFQKTVDKATSGNSENTTKALSEVEQEIEKVAEQNEKIAEIRVKQADDDPENAEKWEKKVNKEEKKRLKAEEEVLSALIRAQDKDVVAALGESDRLEAQIATNPSLNNTEAFQKALASRQNARKQLDQVEELLRAAEQEDHPEKRMKLLKEATVLQQEALETLESSNTTMQQLMEMQPANSTASEQVVLASEKSNADLASDIDTQMQQLREKQTAYSERAAQLRDSASNAKKKYRSAILEEADRNEALAEDIAGKIEVLQQQKDVVAQKANLEKSIQENQKATTAEPSQEDLASEAYKEYYEKQDKIGEQRETLEQVREKRVEQEQEARKKVQAATVVYEEMQKENDPEQKKALEEKYEKLKTEAKSAQESAQSLRQKESDLETQVLKNELDAQIALKEALGDDADAILAMEKLTAPGEIENNTNTNNTTTIADATYSAPESVDQDYFDLTNGSAAYSREKPIPIDEKQPEGIVFKVQIGAFRNAISPDQFNEFKPLSGESIGDGITRYLVGYFNNFESADEAKGKIRELGYPDAFVVAYKNGKRISVTEARSGTSNVVAQNNTTDNGNNETSNTTQNNTATNNSSNNENEIENNSTSENKNEITTSTTPEVNADGSVKSNDVEQLKGLFYTVQIGVYSTPVEPSQLFNIAPVNSERTANDNIRYTTGIFNNLETASQRKEEVRNKGVSDAFVTAYYNGKRITITRSRELIAEQGDAVFVQTGGNEQAADNTTENTTATQDNASTETEQEYYKEGVYYRVNIGSFKEKVPTKLANYVLRHEDQYFHTEEDIDGITHYSTERFKDYGAAVQMLESVRAENMQEAKLIAFYMYDTIPVAKARAIQSGSGVVNDDKEEDLSNYVKEGVYFKVFLGKFVEGIPAKVALLLTSESEDLFVESELDIEGATSIYVGKTDDYSEILDLEQELQEQGYSAEVKGFYKYDEIPLSKALKILSSDVE